MLKEYFTISEILGFNLEGYSSKPKLIEKIRTGNWLFRVYKTSKKDGKEYHISNFPSTVRTKIIEKLLAEQKKHKISSAVENSIKLAYARFELIDYIKNNNITKQEFIKKYNKKQIPLNAYDLIPNIKRATFYRWLDLYAKQNIEGLRDKSNERKAGKSKDDAVKDIVIGIIAESKHIKPSVIHEFLKNQAKKGLINTLPTYATVLNWVKDFKTQNKAQYAYVTNPDKYKSNYMLALGSYSEEANEPNYLWELDSTPADVMTLEGRVNILGCIDVFTRRVKFLTQKTSNSLGITSLLRQCILDWGIPQIIKTDNGKDYTSTQIKVVLDKLNIQHRLCTPFQGWEKPHIERVFGNLQHGLITASKSYIGHNVATRKEIEAVKSFAERMKEGETVVAISVKTLQNYLNWWSNIYYISKKHLGLAKYLKKHELEIEATPAAVLEYSTRQGFIPKLPDNTRILDQLLEPLAGLRIIGKKGIRVENANYFNPNLAINVGQEVYVRVDRFDMGKIYVFDKAHNFLSEAVNYELLGEDKLAFIAKSKAVQKEANKEVRKKAKRLMSKTKEIAGFIGVDLKEIEEKVTKPKTVTTTKAEATQEDKQKKEEAKERFNFAKELEAKLAEGKEIPKEDKAWLESYKKHEEYYEQSLQIRLEQEESKHA